MIKKNTQFTNYILVTCCSYKNSETVMYNGQLQEMYFKYKCNCVCPNLVYNNALTSENILITGRKWAKHYNL